MKNGLRIKKAALYDPYLDTLGGGEKHILSILKALEDLGYEINIFWDKNLQQQIEDRFMLQYVNKLKFLPNIFNSQDSRNPKSFLNKLMVLKNFDIFFYVTDGSYFFSSAKKNYIFCMVPDKKLFNLSLINKIKTVNYQFISNSLFTQLWLKKWGIKSSVIYPFLNPDFLEYNPRKSKKENIILSVGRFYSHLHTKKQSELIKLFNKLKQANPLFKNFKLILAGGLKEEDNNYFNQLNRQLNNKHNVLLLPNIEYTKLLDLFQKSKIYIHLTGYGIDENINPDQVEHLGIAPLEAMASGCLTFAYNAGGLKEIISDGQNGFLFKNEEELSAKLSKIIQNPILQSQVIEQAKLTVKEKFSYEVFKQRIMEVFL